MQRAARRPVAAMPLPAMSMAAMSAPAAPDIGGLDVSAPSRVPGGVPPVAQCALQCANVRPPGIVSVALAGLRILLVEDDPDTREIAVALLTHEGAHVTTAGTADEAIGFLLAAMRLDLLLSDVMLPGDLSGMDVVDASRRVRPHLPALLASGHARPETALGRARPSGVRLLHKPYRRTELLAAIGQAMAAA